MTWVKADRRTPDLSSPELKKAPMTALQWTDDFALGVPQMDATHQEFVALLADVARAGDATLLARWQALVDHTAEHFAQEDRWMKDLGFSADNCHSSQHGQVLAVMREVRRQHAEGQSDLIGRLLPELMTWFENHAQAADAGLAGSMEDVGYDVKSGVMTNPPRGGATAEDGEPVTENSGCGSSSC